MPYVIQSDLEGMVPAEYLDQALNDTGEEGGEDSGWEKVYEAVQDDIDGRLSVSFAVPLADPVPPLVHQAAKILASWYCYARRGVTGDSNPWQEQATSWRKRLDTIGTTGKGLYEEEAVSGSAVVSDSKLHDASGRLMV